MSGWGYRRGRAIDTSLMERLEGDPEERAGTSKGQLWLMALSALLLVTAVGCVAAAVWVWTTDWPTGVKLLAALGLLLLVAALVPRPLRVPRGNLIPENQGLELRRLMAEVAAAAGTPVPDSILVDMSLNAGVARYGWRQRSLLVIGAPMWLILPSEARISVLAHEFGHLLNNDPMRSTLTLPARTFGARAVAVTGGRNPWSRALDGAERAAWHGGGLMSLLTGGLVAVVNTAAATVQLLVDAVAMPDSRRAEFLADIRAREVAGTRAFLVSSERILLSDGILQDLWDRAPRINATELEAAVAESAANRSRELGLRRQASIRSTDLWSSHPAESDRMSLVECLPAIDGKLTISPDRWAAIDAEMAGWTARVHRTLLGTRDPL